MGKCASCLRGAKEEEEEDEERGEGEGGRRAFSEEVTRRSKDGEEKKRRRRKSSGTSRFSTRDQHVVEKPFRIAAFNVRRFGTAKMKDKEVVEVLVNIVRQHDIILIQEVVDNTGKSVQELLEAVNAVSGDEDPEYAVVLSPRLGRGNQKEQYAFFYRAGRVEVGVQAMYPDPGDLYMREPFLVQFMSRAVSELLSKSFSLLALHTQPSSAAREIDCLVEVVEWARGTDSNLLILGDLNAGGAYFSGADLASCRLRRDEQYHWLIPDHTDTTATATLAAYDRLIVVGEELLSAVIPNSAGVLRFDEEMNLSSEAALRVSDHYPVCLQLRPAVHPAVAKNIEARVAVIVRDKRFPDIAFTDFVTDFKVTKFKLIVYFDEKQELARLEIKSQKLSKPADVIKSLEALRSKHESLISYSLLSAVRHKVMGEVGEEGGEGMWLNITVDIPRKEFSCIVETKTALT